MFNTKRIKALEEAITMLSRESFNALKRITKIEKKEIPNLIPCSTCKCLIRKEDAISGKSEIQYKTEGHELPFSGYKVTKREEYIFTPYYCHSKDCKPKK